MVFGLYFPRHRRRDMVVAYLGMNVGILSVAIALTDTADTAGLGLGIGLFGVLSIIRLRSEPLDQEEIAYYFSALALGLLAGLPISPDWLPPVLMGAIIVALYVGDHPALLKGYATEEVRLDRAYADAVELRTRLEILLGAHIRRVKVRQLDMVRNTTTVEVRFRRKPGLAGEPSQPRKKKQRDISPTGTDA